MGLDRYLEIVGFALGLLYLYWEYHANSKMWLVGIIMPLVSMWVYFSKGLYADFAMNIYYVIMTIYGYVVWTFSLTSRKPHNRAISHIPWQYIIGGVLAFCGVYAILAAWLVNLTDSTVPYLDALTTAGSIIGTWMLARKYIEQWFVWIMVDAVSVGLYAYKGIYFYSALYLAYTVIAFFGYAKWRRLMRSAPTQA